MAEITADNASSTRLLARNAFMELVFDPGPGAGNVIVSALVQDPKFIKREIDTGAGRRGGDPAGVMAPCRWRATTVRRY